MAFTVTVSSLKFYQIAGDAAGRAEIYGIAVMDGGTTSGVLNPVTLAGLITNDSELSALIRGCRRINLVSAFDQTAATAIQVSAITNDTTTDCDQVTITAAAANHTVAFKLECRKTA